MYNTQPPTIIKQAMRLESGQLSGMHMLAILGPAAGLTISSLLFVFNLLDGSFVMTFVLGMALFGYLCFRYIRPMMQGQMIVSVSKEGMELANSTEGVIKWRSVQEVEVRRPGGKGIGAGAKEVYVNYLDSAGRDETVRLKLALANYTSEQVAKMMNDFRDKTF